MSFFVIPNQIVGIEIHRRINGYPGIGVMVIRDVCRPFLDRAGARRCRADQQSANHGTRAQKRDRPQGLFSVYCQWHQNLSVLIKKSFFEISNLYPTTFHSSIPLLLLPKRMPTLNNLRGSAAKGAAYCLSSICLNASSAVLSTFNSMI